MQWPHSIFRSNSLELCGQTQVYSSALWVIRRWRGGWSTYPQTTHAPLESTETESAPVLMASVGRPAVEMCLSNGFLLLTPCCCAKRQTMMASCANTNNKERNIMSYKRASQCFLPHLYWFLLFVTQVQIFNRNFIHFPGSPPTFSGKLSF